MNHPVTMALLLVKELRKLDLLEEVILANDIGCLRVCAHCGKLMNTGWSCADSPYCSDRCLHADNPDIDLNELAKRTDANWMLPMSFGRRGKILLLIPLIVIALFDALDNHFSVLGVFG